MLGGICVGRAVEEQLDAQFLRGPVGAAFFLWDIGMKQGDPRLLGTLAYATPIASTLLLCLAGYAPLTLPLLAAAGLVTAGGVLAAKA